MISLTSRRTPMSANESIKIICKNSKARFNFEIEDTFEQGLCCSGPR